MQEKLNPLIGIAVAVVVAGLFVFFLIRALAPHEQVFTNLNAKAPGQGKRDWAQAHAGQTAPGSSPGVQGAP